VLEAVYLSYSSLALITMGCSTFALSIFFRQRQSKVNGLLKNLSPKIFDKTFSVFNPYPEHRKILHGFLSIWDIIVIWASLFTGSIALIIYESGFLISFFLVLFCLNLMFVDLASEVYKNFRDFIRAVNKKVGFGVGDLEVVRELRRVMPKLSNYYLFLAVLFFVFAFTENYTSSFLLWLFFQPIPLVFEVSKLTGIFGWQVVVMLYAALVSAILLLSWKIKNKLLGYILGQPNLESWEIKHRL